MSNNTATTQESSGFVRVTYSSPQLDELAQAQANSTYQAARVTGGVIKATGGQVQDAQSVSRYSVADEQPHNSGSIVATRQTVNGFDTVELQPGNPASRTTLETAFRTGLIRELGNGIYADVAGTTPQGVPQQAPSETPQAQPEGEQAFGFLPKGDAELWNRELEPLPQQSFDNAVASVVSSIGTGRTDLSGVAAKLAADAGLELDHAQEFVDTGVEFYKRSLSQDLAKNAGIPKSSVEDFYKWAQGQRRLPEALSKLAHEGSTSVFREMAVDFKRQSGSKVDTSVYTKAGFQTMTDPQSGELLVRKAGQNWVKAQDL